MLTPPFPGAAHVAKALESNSSVAVLDLSGCHVSATTCAVLVETLQTNRTLAWLSLQDNPLGTSGARKLLHAVHDGERAGGGEQRWLCGMALWCDLMP